MPVPSGRVMFRLSAGAVVVSEAFTMVTSKLSGPCRQVGFMRTAEGQRVSCRLGICPARAAPVLAGIQAPVAGL